jgi:hypothetical protein
MASVYLNMMRGFLFGGSSIDWFTVLALGFTGTLFKNLNTHQANSITKIGANYKLLTPNLTSKISIIIGTAPF